MRSNLLKVSCLAHCLALGCFPPGQKTALVPENPFGRPPVVQAQVNPTLPQATLQTAARVDQVGTRIMAANRQLGLRPKFFTLGAPQPEVFHRGTADIYITEGLVTRCATDGQLASVLCLELGKMVAERETLTASHVRLPERAPPMEVAPGNDYAGAFGPAGQLHRAEVGKYEEERRERAAAAQTPPDPQVLARDILVRAGFVQTDFEATLPLLKGTDGGALSRQLLNQQPPEVEK